MRKDRRKMKNAFVEYADYNDISNFHLLHEKQILEEGVTSTSIDPYTGDTICLGFSGNEVEIFSTRTGKILNSFDKLSESGSRIIFSEFLSSGHTEDDIYEILIISSNGESRVLSFNTDTKSLTVISQKKLGNDLVQSVMHPMGNLVFSITENGRNWNLFD
jgi:WD40 repeat protein